MRKSIQRGFTLIELVVVIVILGILAAFAVPKFIGLETQARIATLNAMSGSLRSAATMAYGVALATGQTGAAGAIPVNGVAVPVAFGYPTAAATSMQTLVDITAFTPVTAGTTVTFRLTAAPTPANCTVAYTQSAAANTPPLPPVITPGGC